MYICIIYLFMVDRFCSFFLEICVCVFVYLEEFEVSGLRGIVEVLMEVELEARNLLFFF